MVNCVEFRNAPCDVKFKTQDVFTFSNEGLYAFFVGVTWVVSELVSRDHTFADSKPVRTETVGFGKQVHHNVKWVLSIHIREIFLHGIVGGKLVVGRVVEHIQPPNRAKTRRKQAIPDGVFGFLDFDGILDYLL